MPTTADLRDLLEADAAAVATNRPSVAAVIRRGRRVRALRRAAVPAAAVVAAGAIALPVLGLDRPLHEPRSEPTTGATASAGLPPGGGWVADLPGLDLPVGPPLETAYAAGHVVVVGSSSHQLGGGAVVQLVQVPEGVVVVSTVSPSSSAARSSDGTLFELRLLVDDGTTVRWEPIDGGLISGVRALVDPSGTSPTRLAWITYAEEGDQAELRSMVLGDRSTMSTVVGPFQDVGGFLEDDVLASTEGSLVRWTPGTEVVREVAATPADGSFPLAVARPGPNVGLAVMYEGESPQCTYAAPVTDLSVKRWERCEGGPVTVSPDGRLAANQVRVLDVATGAVVSTFDFGSDVIRPWDAGPAIGDDLGGIEVRVVGWSGEDVLIHLTYATAASTTPAEGGAWTVNPWYVGVRCSALSGACQRLPHAIDVVDGPLGG